MHQREAAKTYLATCLISPTLPLSPPLPPFLSPLPLSITPLAPTNHVLNSLPLFCQDHSDLCDQLLLLLSLLRIGLLLVARKSHGFPVIAVSATGT